MEKLNEVVAEFAIRRAILGSDEVFTISEVEEARQQTDLSPLEWCILDCKAPWLTSEERKQESRELLQQREKWEIQLLFPEYIPSTFSRHLMMYKGHPRVMLRRHEAPWNARIPVEAPPRHRSRLWTWKSKVSSTTVSLSQRWQ